METRNSPVRRSRPEIVVFPVPEGAEMTNNRPGERTAAADDDGGATVIKTIRHYTRKPRENRPRFVYNGGVKTCAVKINVLRCLAAMDDNEMNVSAAARELRMLQPSVSKNLTDLEKEMGPLFVRRGRRFCGMTPLGREMLAEARDILLKCDNIAALKRRYGAGGGDLRIGTTHLQARYILPAVVRRYLRQYPEANIQIFQNAPANLVAMLENNLVDVVICTEELENHPRFDSAEAYRWNRALLAPRGHPLAAEKTPTLKKLSSQPLVTYVRGFTGRAAFDAVFRRAGLSPRVSVAAADSDVVKTYVRAGAGVGVVAAVSYDPREDRDLICVSVAHLFPDMRVRMAYLRDKLVTGAMRKFMTLFRRHTAEMRVTLGAKKTRADARP